MWMGNMQSIFDGQMAPQGGSAPSPTMGSTTTTAGKTRRAVSFGHRRSIGRLEAMLLEAKGAWADAEKAYACLLEYNPLDQVIHKRKVAMAKAQGNSSAVVECLNNYLEIFMADHDAWRELAEIYVPLQMYKQAAFCYEDLILCQPLVLSYHLTYAEVLYIMGGLENLQAAKKYSASAINLTGGKNTRALYGVCLCSVAICQLPRVGIRKRRALSFNPLLQKLC